MKKNKLKFLHTFSVNYEADVEKTETTKDDKGKEIKVTQLVKEEKNINIGIRKPTRRLYDDGDLYHGVELSKAIKSGMLTVSLLRKRYVNDGGYMSEEEKAEYSLNYLALQEKENELQKLRVNLDKLEEDEKQKAVEDVTIQVAELRRKMFEFETERTQLFEQTAESRARNKTIMWWVLHLAYISENEGDWTPMFEGNTFEEKQDKYDEIAEDAEEHLDEACQRLAYYVSFWYTGQIKSEKDFEKAEELIRTSITAEMAMEKDQKEDLEKVEAVVDKKLKELNELDLTNQIEEEVENLKQDKPEGDS